MVFFFFLQEMTFKTLKNDDTKFQLDRMRGKEKEIKSNPEFDKGNSFFVKISSCTTSNPYISSIPVTL